jgi:acetyl-CoA carboxylase alpha subunit
MIQMAEQETMPEAWRRTELARHPDRPYPMEFIEALFTDFSEIHGDRAFGDDAAMACGMARFHGRPVLVVGKWPASSARPILRATARLCAR